MTHGYRQWWWWLFALAGGCSTVGDPGQDVSATTGEDDGDEMIQETVVLGTIVDPQGAPIAGVDVTSGDASALSDADGRFELHAEAGEAIVVALHKAGWMRGLERVAVLDGTPTALRAVMLPEAPAVPLDADVGGVVTGMRGARIDAPPGAFVMKDGTPIAGMVDVHLTPLNPAVPAEYAAYPGDGLARQSDGSVVQLETFGVLDVTVRKDGQDLTIADGMGVQVDFPLPDPPPAEIPETIALWSFDEDAGVWQEEGTATLDAEAGVYRGTLTHLSPWNCDQPLTATCIRGRVVDEEGNPIAGAIVYADGVDYLGGSTATTAADGTFEVAVRKDSQVEITVYDWGNGSAVRQVASGSNDTDVPPTAGDPRCEDVGDFVIVPGEGPAPWDPASCMPPEGEAAHLLTDLSGAFDVQIDASQAGGLQVCGWIVDDPAATEEPSGATWLVFITPDGWQLAVWFETGVGDTPQDATGWVSVTHVDDPDIAGASLCTIDVTRNDAIGMDVYGIAAIGECTGWGYPGAEQDELMGSIDFAGIAGELDGLFPTLCCDLSMMPTMP